MESIMLLWTELLEEFGEWCGISTSGDLKKATARFEHEGVSFFTITLPAFCKDFEKSLDEEQISPDSFHNFKKRNDVPLFLGGFMAQVFERGTGKLLRIPVIDIDCIFAIRQLTSAFAKIEVPCSEARNSFRNIGIPTV